MKARIDKQLEGAGLAVDAEPAAALAGYLSLLGKWNAVHNLTAITEPEAMVERHLVESLALGSLLEGSRIADVGSGAGLPGIPLAIVYPDRQFTLIESRAKRVGFLRHVRGELGLGNVDVVHSRVEDLPEDAPFDTVLARAVAPLGELLSLVDHLLGPESMLLTLTGDSFEGPSSRLTGGFLAERVEGPVVSLLKGSLIRVRRERD